MVAKFIQLYGLLGAEKALAVGKKQVREAHLMIEAL